MATIEEFLASTGYSRNEVLERTAVIFKDLIARLNEASLPVGNYLSKGGYHFSVGVLDGRYDKNNFSVFVPEGPFKQMRYDTLEEMYQYGHGLGEHMTPEKLRKKRSLSPKIVPDIVLTASGYVLEYGKEFGIKYQWDNGNSLALVTLKTPRKHSFDLTTNDKRFLRSLRIGVDEA